MAEDMDAIQQAADAEATRLEKRDAGAPGAPQLRRIADELVRIRFEMTAIRQAFAGPPEHRRRVLLAEHPKRGALTAK
jgi:hypothetical protein